MHVMRMAVCVCVLHIKQFIFCVHDPFSCAIDRWMHDDDDDDDDDDK